MTSLEESEIFHTGIELFNRGRFFDAHEAWEEIWYIASGQKKLFYQGLIQYAVTLEHIRRGNPRGVKCVYETCRTKFAGLAEVYMGIRIADIYEGLQKMVGPVLEMDKSAFDPAIGRGQEMPVDMADSPKIKLHFNPFEEAK